MSYFRFSVGCGEEWTRTTELRRGQIYSLLQLPLCDFPIYFCRTPLWSWAFEPMKGLEPPTGWLQISYSTNWVTSAFSALSNNSFFVLRLQKYYFFFIPQNIFSLFLNIFSQYSVNQYFFPRLISCWYLLFPLQIFLFTTIIYHFFNVFPLLKCLYSCISLNLSAICFFSSSTSLFLFPVNCYVIIIYNHSFSLLLFAANSYRFPITS